MKSFNDNKGRRWDIDITIGAVKRVLDMIKINLLEPDKGEVPVLQRLGTDEILLIDTIFAIISPQAKSLNVSDEEFGASIGGKAVMDAQEAFYEELADFFQSRGRTDRAEMVAVQKKTIDVATKLVTEKIKAINIEEYVKQASGKVSIS